MDRRRGLPGGPQPMKDKQTMQRKTKREIAKIIKGDATLKGCYSDGMGGYCVIGGLLKAAGYPMRDLIDSGRAIANLPEEVHDLLLKTYGLSLDHCRRLQAINDYHFKTVPRRQALLAALEEMELL
jgi:hypothetical protein